MRIVQSRLEAALNERDEAVARRYIDLALAVLSPAHYTDKLKALVSEALARGVFELAEGFLVVDSAGRTFRFAAGHSADGLLPVLGDKPTATCVLWAVDRQTVLKLSERLDGGWSIWKQGETDMFGGESCAEVFELYFEEILGVQKT